MLGRGERLRRETRWCTKGFPFYEQKGAMNSAMLKFLLATEYTAIEE